MFQDMNKAMNQSMGPLKDLIEIQTKMLESLTRQQIECTRSCIEATMQQTQSLQNCQTPNDFLELHKHYTSEIENTLRNVGESNLKTISDARDEFEKLTNDTFDAFATPRKPPE